MPTTIQNGVMIGKDGALFLAHGGHGVLRFATGEARPSPQSIANMAENLEDRRRAAREGGFRFASIIAPEKYRVYPEWCPVELPFSLARHYIDGGCTGVIDPVDTLRSAKPGPSMNPWPHIPRASMRPSTSLVQPTMGKPSGVMG